MASVIEIKQDGYLLFVLHTVIVCENIMNLKKHLRHQFFSSFIDEINNIAPRDSKQFWQSLKKIKKRQTVSSNSISESEWVEYYKSLLDNNSIRVITKLPNSEQSNKGKVKTHKYINRQNQSTTGKL